jgi:hypothetical protein
MRVKLQHLLFCVKVSLISSLLSSCGGTNVDPIGEVSCTTATGLWTVMSATCNGVAVESVDPVTYLFDNQARTITQTTGQVDCASQFQWSYELGTTDPFFNLTGAGRLTCSEEGLNVNSCSSDVNSCNAGIDFTGIRNNYSVCVINPEGMQISRSVTALNNPDNLSYCPVGQEEVVTLLQGDYIPPPVAPPPELGLAFLVIDSSNPFNVGTHPVGGSVTRTLRVTNNGEGDATDLQGEGLNTPFSFFNGAFPGTGGTCGAVLAVGASCNIVIEFSSNIENFFTDNLILSYNNGRVRVTMDLGIVGRATNSLGLLVISNGPFYNFGIIDVNTTSTHIFTVENIGGGSATLQGESLLAPPFRFAGGSYPGDGGDCDGTLNVMESCTLEVEFAPTAAGTFNNSIGLDYNDGSNNQQARRNIFGEAVVP